MNKKAGLPQLTPAQREADNEANRLQEHVADALTMVRNPSVADPDSLEGAADRIERAARDLAVALRGLGAQRRDAAETI